MEGRDVDDAHPAEDLLLLCGMLLLRPFTAGSPLKETFWGFALDQPLKQEFGSFVPVLWSEKNSRKPWRVQYPDFLEDMLLEQL